MTRILLAITVAVLVLVPSCLYESDRVADFETRLEQVETVLGSRNRGAVWIYELGDSIACMIYDPETGTFYDRRRAGE